MSNNYLGLVKSVGFQFPSNGKAYPKVIVHKIKDDYFIYVSIPFKRESLSKEQSDYRETLSRHRFNSLQTGKPIQSPPWFYPTGLAIWGFNSLQTGKPIQSGRGGRIYSYSDGGTVSIPFKRESLSKAMEEMLCFTKIFLFQFPSNGKAYPKRGANQCRLQTGKL